MDVAQQNLFRLGVISELYQRLAVQKLSLLILDFISDRLNKILHGHCVCCPLGL
jgi:hypothetical protein